MNASNCERLPIAIVLYLETACAPLPDFKIDHGGSYNQPQGGEFPFDRRGVKQCPKSGSVTGSSRGLGREIVIAALKAGDSVAASARNVEDLGDLVAEYGDRVLPLTLDVTNWQATTSAVARRRIISDVSISS